MIFSAFTTFLLQKEIKSKKIIFFMKNVTVFLIWHEHKHNMKNTHIIINQKKTENMFQAHFDSMHTDDETKKKIG